MKRGASRMTPLGTAFVMATAMLAAPKVALAHAHLVKSVPSAGGYVVSSPALIQLWFSEAAEPTLTRITLTGPDGTQRSVAPVRVGAADPLLLVATLESPLAAGKYTLTWHTVAKDDGHPSAGSFDFTVDSNPPTASGAARVTDTGAVATSTPQIAKPPVTQPMDLEAPGYVIARWVNFTAIVCILGVIAFRVLVIPGVARLYDSGSTSSFADIAIRRAAGLGLLAGIAAVLGSVCRLYAEQAVIGADVQLMTILHTFWGRVWTLQLALALAACVMFGIARFARVGVRTQAWIAASVAALLIGAAPAFSGHALAATRYRGLSVMLDIIHVIAAGGWLGGLCAVAIAGIPAALASASDTRAHDGVPLVAAVVNAFSPTALVFAGFVIVSGVIAAWLRVGSFGQLFHSTYGTILLIKLCLVILVLAGGAFNWLRMRGALSHRDTERTTTVTFRRSAWLELSAGVLVILATAVLVAAQPPIR